MELLDEVIEVCKDIRRGDVDDQPFVYMGKKAFIAGAKQEDHRIALSFFRRFPRQNSIKKLY